MIQLNLLPDVKMEYIKAQRTRRTVLSVAFLSSVLSVALLVLLLVVSGLQKKHLSDLSKDIAAESSELQQKPQIDKVLTVQNQLESITALHASKPATYRLFQYLNEVTPSTVGITDLSVDFTTQTVTITGTSSALNNVNKYIDTLKFTTYSNGDTEGTKAFNNIVLTSFGLNSTATDPKQAASYTITANYEPAIFDITQTITLSVPHQVTTRAVLEQPQADLFQEAPATTNGGSN